MDYRSLNINEFNSLNQSVVADEAAVAAGISDYEQFIRRGKAERARITLEGIRSIRKAIGGMFA